jgi:ribosome-associated protein
LRHDSEIRQFQRIERWRDRLLSDPATAVAELLNDHPGADRSLVMRLAEKAGRESREQRSPAGARELFAYLRQLLD